MNSPNDIPDEVKVHRSLVVIPASSVRIVKVSSAEAFKVMKVDFERLRRGLMQGGKIVIDKRKLL